jgi:hypothetical protein
MICRFQGKGQYGQWDSMCGIHCHKMVTEVIDAGLLHDLIICTLLLLSLFAHSVHEI